MRGAAEKKISATPDPIKALLKLLAASLLNTVCCPVAKTPVFLGFIVLTAKLVSIVADALELVATELRPITAFSEERPLKVRLVSSTAETSRIISGTACAGAMLLTSVLIFLKAYLDSLSNLLDAKLKELAVRRILK